MSAADIKQKLEKLNIRANAALGQNFLCEDAMIEKIASAAVGDGKTDILETVSHVRPCVGNARVGRHMLHCRGRNVRIVPAAARPRPAALSALRN